MREIVETLGVKNAQLHLFSRKLQWEISSHASSHPLCMNFQHLEKPGVTSRHPSTRAIIARTHQLLLLQK